MPYPEYRLQSEGPVTNNLQFFHLYIVTLTFSILLGLAIRPDWIGRESRLQTVRDRTARMAAQAWPPAAGADGRHAKAALRAFCVVFGWWWPKAGDVLEWVPAATGCLSGAPKDISRLKAMTSSRKSKAFELKKNQVKDLVLDGLS